MTDREAGADTDSVDAEHPSELLLARAFVQEAHTIALLTAGAASAANYAYKFANADPLIEARSLISSYQSNIANWPHRVLAEQFSYDTIQMMIGLDSAFRHGREGLTAFEIDGSGIGFHRAVALHASKLATAWRDAASIAVALVASLRDEAVAIFSDEFSTSSDQLIKVLDSVIDGNPECCQPDGKIVLPKLAERRHAARHALLQPVRVRVGNDELRAFATDISSGGIGLSRIPQLAPGTHIVIELAVGRSLSGTIAWSRGSKVGVAFDQPLSPTDPLIFG
ncbi:MAG TPA: PilZ domain-containing protein [Hyphomicrobiaceae bacterium]|nr:PilZ domain-containing protein [Hyphomicrobiaceae bacterium]